jgi:hypothetical protein
MRDAENIPVLSVRPYPKTSSSLKGAIRKRNFHELFYMFFLAARANFQDSQLGRAPLYPPGSKNLIY